MNQRRHSHRFAAHLREDGVHARQWVANAESFIDAAVQFAETHPVKDEEASVVVTDCESGKERCFLVNFQTGNIQAC
jgi:hypothetical protein